MIQHAWQSFLDQADRAAGPTTRGIAWLPELRVAAFEGADARRFLQGYLTCDTADLDAMHFLPAAICSLKGRVVVNGWCTASTPTQVLFVIHESLFASLEDLLKPYLRFSRTRLADLGTERLVFGGQNLDATAGGIPLDPFRQLFLCASVDEAGRLWDSQPHLSPGEWQARMIADGLPLVTAATSDAFLPQMLDLPALGAVNFNKGCYLGQEVVARAQHRGQVKRHLARLAWRGGAAPAPGAELADAEGRNRGVVIQTAGGPDAGTALAVVQDETSYPLNLGATTFTPAG